jgi:hypothetical protein
MIEILSGNPLTVSMVASSDTLPALSTLKYVSRYSGNAIWGPRERWTEFIDVGYSDGDLRAVSKTRLVGAPTSDGL